MTKRMLVIWCAMLAGNGISAAATGEWRQIAVATFFQGFAFAALRFSMWSTPL